MCPGHRNDLVFEVTVTQIVTQITQKITHVCVTHVSRVPWDKTLRK